MRELREATMGHDRPEVAMAYNNLGSNALRRGASRRGADQSKGIALHLREVLGPNHPDLAYPIFNIGDTLRATGRNEEARPYYERVRRIWS